MKKIIFNIFLFVAVPIATGGNFHVMFIGNFDVAIIGRKTGLPACWSEEANRKYWHNTKRLFVLERDTERMSYPSCR